MSDGYPVASKRPADMSLLGLPMNRVGMREVHAFIAEVIGRDEKAVALNLNVYCVNLALKYSWLHEFIRGAQLVFCDGDGVRLGLKILGYTPPEKVTYNKWIWKLSEFCAENGFRLFLVGAKPGIVEEAARNLQARYSRLQIAGTHHGYFNKSGEENEKVITLVNKAKPDILLTCLGMPEQEKWISENWQKLQAHIFLKGGAAFDYASGRLAPAPEWIIRLHFEWLFRFIQDPVRLFNRYIIGNPYFLLQVLMEKAGLKYRKSV